MTKTKELSNKIFQSLSITQGTPEGQAYRDGLKTAFTLCLAAGPNAYSKAAGDMITILESEPAPEEIVF